MYVTVCLHTLPEGFEDTVPVSAAAWSQEVFPSGTVLEPVTEGGYEPAYPQEAELAVGDCAEGYVSAKETDEELDGLLVHYENSLGAKGSWSFDRAKRPGPTAGCPTPAPQHRALTAEGVRLSPWQLR